MTMSANFHRIKSVAAEIEDGHSWLTIKDHEDNRIVLHMEAHKAEAMAQAWADAQIEPEPIDPETVAQRDEAYHSDMIAAGRGHLLKG